MAQISDTNSITHIKVGTRQSPLAMVQANLVKGWLVQYYEDITVEIVPINTTGDTIQDKRLADVGGKGLFTKELDIALLDGRCDIAVHSLKDVETVLPLGTEIACILPREETNDVLISRDGTKLADLKHGAVIGTSSLRRQAQLLQLRPDFKIVVFRGNVGTRLQKLADGVADATVLALAGLNRLNMADVATEILDTDKFIPAVGQGVIAVQCISNNQAIKELLKPLHCEKTSISVKCERAMLSALDGTCKTPVGGEAILDEGGNVTLTAFASIDDGTIYNRLKKTTPVAEAEKLGLELGLELRTVMGDDFDRM